MSVVAVVVVALATVLAGLRWLRVAQREHYEPGRVTRFAARWWSSTPANAVIGALAVVSTALSGDRPLVATVAALTVAVGPLGLTLRGRRPGPLAWTRRLRTLAGVAAVAAAGLLAATTVLGLPAVTALVAPLVVDLAVLLALPLENRLANRHVAAARRKLASVRPRVVAITGSYGKTSTKGYLAHLVAPALRAVASPASFNNRAGLARAVNEHLAPGTEVFVAEMGTYGPGEIAALCRWLPPDVAAITAIGPVHLERFRSEDRTLEAKAEILEAAGVAVLNVDDARLAALADRVETDGRTVIRVTTTDPLPAEAPPGAPRANVAVAVALARALGVGDEVIAARLPSLPSADHRLTVSTGAGGFTILDDTYNANPAGAAYALELLATHANPGSRAVVVTPGMIELGPRQADENERFAAAAAAVATDLVVVGRTNRAALRRGGGDEVIVVDDHDDAVRWVIEHLGPGDVVLYENQLPDHFP